MQRGILKASVQLVEKGEPALSQLYLIRTTPVGCALNQPQTHMSPLQAQLGIYFTSLWPWDLLIFFNLGKGPRWVVSVYFTKIFIWHISLITFNYRLFIHFTNWQKVSWVLFFLVSKRIYQNQASWSATLCTKNDHDTFPPSGKGTETMLACCDWATVPVLKQPPLTWTSATVGDEQLHN